MRKALILVFLAACQPAPPSSPPAPDDCGAAGFQGLIGQPLSALPGQGPWGRLRVIRPGDVVTEDYSTSRLNVALDGFDRIATLTCG